MHYRVGSVRAAIGFRGRERRGEEGRGEREKERRGEERRGEEREGVFMRAMPRG